MKTVVTLLAVLMYVFAVAFQRKKVIFTTAAALIVIALGAIFPGRIFPLPEDILAMGSDVPQRVYPVVHSFLEIINWNVIMIYLGSMIIASLFIYSGAPARWACGIVNRSRSPRCAQALILALTGVISIFIGNVATVLVMAPVALALCSRLKTNPARFLMGLAVMSNLEGAATLVGGPPSIIFASYAGYSFNDFFVREGRLSIFFVIQAGMLAGCVFFYFFFARNLGEKTTVESQKVVSYFPFICLLLMIAALATVSDVHISYEYLGGTLVLALGAAGLLWYAIFQKKGLKGMFKMIRALDWETIFFLLGIFIVVGAMRETGVLDDLAAALTALARGSKVLGFILILVISVVISGFADNAPYIAAMLPAAGAMALSMGVNQELYLFALLVGSCLGGNLTPFGARGNIAATGILKREGCPIKFSFWLKAGSSFTIITTAVAAAVLWLLWA